MIAHGTCATEDPLLASVALALAVLGRELRPVAAVGAGARDFVTQRRRAMSEESPVAPKTAPAATTATPAMRIVRSQSLLA